MINLNPCPFCGGEVDYNVDMDLHPDGVICRKCRYVIRYYGLPHFKQTDQFSKIMEPIAERWNKRQ